MKQAVQIYVPSFFPTKYVAEIPPHAACQAVNKCFIKWGVPKRIKIDNGLPFANARYRDIPTLSQLWWIGLGIEVQLNAPRCPQQNGIVEGLQGICKRWSAVDSYEQIQDYQQRINETLRIQAEVYRIRKKGDKTRKELYPELWKPKRPFRPDDFDLSRVLTQLADRVWKRSINKGGKVKFWGQSIYLGKRFVNQPLFISLDPELNVWYFRTEKGHTLKTIQNNLFSEKDILIHAGVSKN